MALPVNSIGGGLRSDATVENLHRGNRNCLDVEKQRLRKATKEFESLFMYEMLKAMRKTVPGGTESEKALFSNDLGKDTFTQLFDMELARRMVDGGRESIAGILYSSLEKIVEAQYGVEQEADIKQLRNPAAPIQLQDKGEGLPLPGHQPLKLTIPDNKPVPLRTGAVRGGGDPIMSRFGRFIDEAARDTSLDSTMIYAVIKAESAGDPGAVSPAGAKGLMQLTDSTAQDFGVMRVFDPRENILAGSRYLRHLVDRFGDLKLALAAYNAGPGKVEQYQGIPPFSETRAYIDRVLEIAASCRHALASHHTKASMGTSR
ncbi:MAG: transglycosylase SLT domain-containing protein [Candidatus Zixiibacteriota bacterium]